MQVLIVGIRLHDGSLCSCPQATELTLTESLAYHDISTEQKCGLADKPHVVFFPHEDRTRVINLKGSEKVYKVELFLSRVRMWVEL